MTNSVRDFYENLAGDYHLIFDDWEADMVAQGEVLDGIIRQAGLGPAATVLDCACGIGTQAIALAQRGYSVHATDFSAAAVAQARATATRLGTDLTFGIADMRHLPTEVAGTFDVVMSCDNVLAHFLTDDSLRAVAESMAAMVVPGGLLIATIRDYDAIVAGRPAPREPHMDGPEAFEGPDGRRLVFQVWDWTADGRGYTAHHFIVQRQNGGWQPAHRTTSFRAVLRADVSAALAAAGLVEIRWWMPEESGYYQPLVTARRPVGDS